VQLTGSTNPPLASKPLPVNGTLVEILETFQRAARALLDLPLEDILALETQVREWVRTRGREHPHHPWR
jgi:hypothetical protein